MVKAIRGQVGRFLRWWPVRFLVGPLVLGGSPLLFDTGKSQALGFGIGLVLVESSNIATARHEEQLRNQRERARAAAALAQQQRHLTELLIDAVTVLGLSLPAEGGRFRANVMIVSESEDALAMAYQTPGYSEEEQAMLWRRREGAVGRCWDDGAEVIAPRAGEPLPTAAGEAGPDDGWGMTATQIARAHRVRTIVSVPIFDLQRPDRVRAVLTFDDLAEAGDRLGPMREAARILATERVRPALEETGYEFPD